MYGVAVRVNRVLKRLEKSHDKETLHRTARAFGDELPRGRLEVLSEFRAGLARQQPKDDFTDGYLWALRDVGAAYEAVLGEYQKDGYTGWWMRQHHIIAWRAGGECPECCCSYCYIENLFWEDPTEHIEYAKKYIGDRDDERNYISRYAAASRFVCPSCERRKGEV